MAGGCDTPEVHTGFLRRSLDFLWPFSSFFGFLEGRSIPIRSSVLCEQRHLLWIPTPSVAEADCGHSPTRDRA